jgi:hypothetical protein
VSDRAVSRRLTLMSSLESGLTVKTKIKPDSRKDVKKLAFFCNQIMMARLRSAHTAEK